MDNKRVRRVVFCLLSLVVLLGLCACGDKAPAVGNGQGDTGNSDASAPQEPITIGTVRYTVERHDYSIVEDDREFSIYFDAPIFSGEARIMDKVNADIAALDATYREEMVPRCEEEKASLLANDFPYDGDYSYAPYHLESVFCDENYLSIGWSQFWFAGGVSNDVYDALNYDLSTMEPLTVYVVLGDRAKEYIGKALAEIIPDNTPLLDDNAMENLHFYFDDENVYVCFDSYALHQGYWGLVLTIPRA